MTRRGILKPTTKQQDGNWQRYAWKERKMDDTIDEGAGELGTQVDSPVTAEQENDPRLATDHAARARAEREARNKPPTSPKEELKPWESKEAQAEKEKGHTPRWARERLREVTGTNRELKDHVTSLTSTVQNLLKRFQPKETDVKEEDFPTKADYIRHIASQTVNDTVGKVEQARIKDNAERKEREETERADVANTEAALKHIPDYHDRIADGDPELRLPVAAIKHLAISPAGPYVKYRIATDLELSNELKGLEPQAKIARVAQLHDSVLDWLIQQQGNAPSAPTTPAQPKQSAPVAPQAQRKPAPPVAPPRSRGGGSTAQVDPHRLSGDDYVKWYNSQRRS